MPGTDTRVRLPRATPKTSRIYATANNPQAGHERYQDTHGPRRKKLGIFQKLCDSAGDAPMSSTRAEFDCMYSVHSAPLDVAIGEAHREGTVGDDINGGHTCSAPRTLPAAAVLHEQSLISTRAATGTHQTDRR